MSHTGAGTRLSRCLGAAFLLQAATSLTSGALLLNPLVDTDNIRNTMLHIGNHTGLVRASMIGDIVTALGIIWLGTMLYAVAERRYKVLALTALGFYIFEAGLLAVSKVAVFVLLYVNQEFAATGNPNLEMMAELALTTKDFTYRLHMIPFGLGAIIFYSLLLQSRVVPAWLSLWGVIAVSFVLVGALWIITGMRMPSAFLALALPYVPFEFAAGAYILVKGFLIQPGRN